MLNSDTPKSVLVICDGFLPPKVKVTGGKNLYLIQRRLSRNFLIHLLVFVHKETVGDWQKWRDEEEAKYNLKFHVFSVPFRNFYPLHHLLTKLVSSFAVIYVQLVFKCGLIHEYSSLPFLINRTSLAGSLTGAKTVHTICTVNRGLLARINLIFKKTNKIICTNQFESAKLEEKLNTKVNFIPIPIEDRFFLPQPKGEKERFKIKTAKSVLFCGMLDERKGVSCFLKAIPAILLSNSDAGIVILTSPGFNTSARGKYYKEKITLLMSKYNGRITFMEEELDMPLLFSEIDIFVYPSLTMHGTLGSPSVLIEAMASAKAIVSSLLPELTTIIKDGENGLLFAPGDYQGLTKCVNRLFSEPEFLRKLGEQARVDSQEYRISCAYDKIAELYNELKAK